MQAEYAQWHKTVSLLSLKLCYSEVDVFRKYKIIIDINNILFVVVFDKII